MAPRAYGRDAVHRRLIAARVHADYARSTRDLLSALPDELLDRVFDALRRGDMNEPLLVYFTCKSLRSAIMRYLKRPYFLHYGMRWLGMTCETATMAIMNMNKRPRSVLYVNIEYVGNEDVIEMLSSCFGLKPTEQDLAHALDVDDPAKMRIMIKNLGVDVTSDLMLAAMDTGSIDCFDVLVEDLPLRDFNRCLREAAVNARRNRAPFMRTYAHVQRMAYIIPKTRSTSYLVARYQRVDDTFRWLLPIPLPADAVVINLAGH